MNKQACRGWLPLMVLVSALGLTIAGCDKDSHAADAQVQGDTGVPDASHVITDGQAPDDGGVPGDAAPDGGPVSELLLVDAVDQQFTYDDNGFHPLIEPGDPLPADDWLSPIDYYNGEFHIRYVITAPADQADGRIQTCIWTMGDDGVGGNYFPESCSEQVAHQGVGTYYNTNLVPSAWWKKDGVPLDFSHPERFLIRVVLRGTDGCVVTRYDVGNDCWNLWDQYSSMIFRVTIVMVASGETFSGWANYP